MTGLQIHAFKEIESKLRNGGSEEVYKNSETKRSNDGVYGYKQGMGG